MESDPDYHAFGRRVTRRGCQVELAADRAQLREAHRVNPELARMLDGNHGEDHGDDSA